MKTTKPKILKMNHHKIMKKKEKNQIQEML